jgi:hypothetical protein
MELLIGVVAKLQADKSLTLEITDDVLFSTEGLPQASISGLFFRTADRHLLTFHADKAISLKVTGTFRF